MRRFTSLVLLAGLLFWSSPASATSGNLPDMIVTEVTGSDYEVLTYDFRPPPIAYGCAVDEGYVSSFGVHRLLRFTVEVANIGVGDLRIGNPERHPEWYYWSSCHNHWHFDGYARYRLLTPSGDEVAAGFKRGFCFVDLRVYDSMIAHNGKYQSCETHQGVSVGWADVYYRTLEGQWVVIDGVPPGVYTLEVTVNYTGQLPESDHLNNVLKVPVTIP